MTTIADTPTIPLLPGATLLGVLDGITYAKLPSGEVWSCAYVRWTPFCTAANWPYTATCRALAGQEQREVARGS